MATLADYVNSLISHVSQTFNGRNETGVDIALPYGSPVYALSSGTVVGSGVYGGGGVEAIYSSVSAPNYNGPADVYYQHLSKNLLQVGQTVQAGQLIGYSGGQIGYGSQPSTTQYSNGPHIEIGLNAPYGGIWGQNPPGPNVNPLPWLQNFFVGGALQSAPGQGVISSVTSVPQAIQQSVSGLTASATTGLKLVGWMLIALAIMGAGAYLLFGAEMKEQTTKVLGTLTGKSGGEAAGVAAGKSKGESEGESEGAEGEAGEAAGASATSEGAELATVAA